MPRLKRNWRPGVHYHVITRGNNRHSIFRTDEDMYHLMRVIHHASRDYQFSIIAFCIMSNHYHLLLRSKDDLSKIMRQINRSYSDYYSKRYRHVGTIYQQQYFSKAVEDKEGLLAVSRHIHPNPIEIAILMVKQLADYPFSSFPIYARNAEPAEFLDTELLPGIFNNNGREGYARFCLEELEGQKK